MVSDLLRCKMASKQYLWRGIIGLLLLLLLDCWAVQGRTTHRKSALGHMLPYDQKSIVVHEIKLASTKSPDLEPQGKGHRSVKRILTGDDIKSMWLEDFNKDYQYEMQSDSADDRGTLISAHEAVAQCPPPPKEVPAEACAARRCTSDKECGDKRERCCYNGCAYTCMAAMPPPPFLDWMKEPPRRLQSGMSWLVPGPDAQDQVESCSTTQWDADEDMLLCPHGFICHIEFAANPSLGVPDRGHCVQENTDSHPNIKEAAQKFKIKSDTVLEGGCSYGGELRQNGEDFIYDKHICHCENGSIACKVGNG